jgi:hypothetical protein
VITLYLMSEKLASTAPSYAPRRTSVFRSRLFSGVVIDAEYDLRPSMSRCREISWRPLFPVAFLGI